MELKFTNVFERDRELHSADNLLFRQLAGKIKEIQEAKSIDDVSGMEVVRGRKVYHRFKITSGKIIYRVGIKILHGKVWFLVIDTYKKRFYKRV